MEVASGVTELVGLETGDISLAKPITWEGSGLVAVNKSYTIPGTDTGNEPTGESSRKRSRAATSTKGSDLL